MTDQEFHYSPNDFQSTPRTRRRWPRFIALFTIAAGVYGAAMGAAIGTTAGAEVVIGIAAAVVAVLTGLPAARFGSLIGILNRARSARRVLGILAATGGAILGGLLGLMLVMPLGALLGAIGGLLLMRAILRRGYFRRIVAGIVGLVLGGCIGSILLAILRDRNAALVGMAWGFGVGVVLGPLPLILFAKMMDSLTPRRYTEGTIIDVKAEDVRNHND